jgi:pimeloyl-ACP methyl ester carboxylesterase
MAPPLVLLHAFPLSAQMWAAQREALADSYAVFTPDQRGFGGRPLGEGVASSSGSPLGDATPSLDVVADDVAALLDAEGLDRVVLGGLSMGGYVAMAFLRRFADRVAALVLADTKAGADTEAARQNRERIARTVLAERAPRVLLDDVLPGLVGATTASSRPQVLERVRVQVEAAPPDAVAWAQRAMANRPDSFDTLRAAGVPALVVVGTEDRLTTVDDARAMVEALPAGRLLTIAGAGHLSAMEDPTEFTAILRGFLAEL